MALPFDIFATIDEPRYLLGPVWKVATPLRTETFESLVGEGV